MASPVSFRIDGLTIALVAGGLLAYYLYKQDFLNKINPASSENVVYQGLNKVVGEENVASGADYFFGAIDLINPFADSTRKEYAKQVYGLKSPQL